MRKDGSGAVKQVRLGIRYGNPVVSVSGLRRSQHLFTIAFNATSTVAASSGSLRVNTAPFSGSGSYLGAGEQEASAAPQKLRPLCSGQRPGQLVEGPLRNFRPGYSERQTRLTVDVGNAEGSCTLVACYGSTAGGCWIAVNAYRYGFIIRYPKGYTNVTRYAYEPWHLRYVGTHVAADMRAHTVRTYKQYIGRAAVPRY